MTQYRKDSKTWEARWYEGKKRKTKSGFITKKLAEIYEARKKIEWQERIAGIKKSGPSNILIEDIFTEYLEYARENKKPRSVERYLSSIRAWRIFFGDNDLIFAHEVTNKRVYKFQKQRLKLVTKTTVNKDCVILMQIFKFAVSRELITENPISKIELFRLDKPGIPRYLTKDEIKVIEKTAKEKNFSVYEAIYILLRTGMRSGELCTLKINQVDLAKQRITLNPEDTKVREFRVVPLGKDLISFLAKTIERRKKEYLAHSDDLEKFGDESVIVKSNGVPQNITNLCKRFRYILEKTGLPNTDNVNIHTLRKTYISHMIMGGADPVKVMAIVGHKDWSTIKRYLALCEDYIKEDSDLLPY